MLAPVKVSIVSPDLFADDTPEESTKTDHAPVTLQESIMVHEAVSREDGHQERAQEAYWREWRNAGWVPQCPGYGLTKGECQADCEQIVNSGIVGAVYYTWSCSYCRDIARADREHRAYERQKTQAPALPERRRGTR